MRKGATFRGVRVAPFARHAGRGMAIRPRDIDDRDRVGESSGMSHRQGRNAHCQRLRLTPFSLSQPLRAAGLPHPATCASHVRLDAGRGMERTWAAMPQLPEGAHVCADASGGHPRKMHCRA